MAAGGPIIQGGVVRRPGVYSTVGADALAAPGVGATGVVALLGTCEGGVPASQVSHGREFLKLSGSTDLGRLRSGDIKEAAHLAFSPSPDPQIAGASSVIVAKANPATQSTARLPNSAGPALQLTSRDYGAHTAGIRAEVLAGTLGGRRYDLSFEGQAETFDNVGSVQIATLQYSASAGWDTMTASVQPSGIKCEATRTELGRGAELLSPTHAAGPLTLSSSDASDTQIVTVYALVSGSPTRLEVTLTGTTPVTTGAVDSNSFAGAELSAAAAGSVTISDSSATNITTFSAGTTIRGVVQATAMFTAGSVAVGASFQGGLSLQASGASTAPVTIWGRTASGSVAEQITLQGTNDVATLTTTWTTIDRIVLGRVDSSVSVEIGGIAAYSLNSLQDTILKADSYFEALSTSVSGNTGFTWNTLSSQLLLDPGSLDIRSGINIAAPATGSLTAELELAVQAINAGSILVQASVVSGASGGAPDLTEQPVPLSGGSEGIATVSHYREALERLEEIRVNTIVDLTGDPAVAALLRAHLQYRAGLGRSEADGTVGIRNASGTDVPSRDELRQQIQAINSRHLRAAVQAFQAFNSRGELAEFAPPFLGALIAGMQAGTPVGVSLTSKPLSVLSLRQSPLWSPSRDADAILGLGAWVAQEVDGVGFRCLRNITTHLSSSNVAFTEASVNEAANFAIFSLRTDLEVAIGDNSTAQTIQALAVKSLEAIIRSGSITAYRNLQITKTLDVARVYVEIAPVVPTNFIIIDAQLFNETSVAEA